MRISTALGLIVIWVMPGRYASKPAANYPSQERPAETELSRHEFKRLVESFGSDEKDSALIRLLSIPRNELISLLDELKKENISNDALDLRIAFLFCRLDHQYQTNRILLRSGLSKSQRTNADTTISLLGALIRRGDRLLLRDIFSACAWSDAAASEAISEIFLEETRNHLTDFLVALKSEPSNVRQGVYRFLRSAWTQEQLLDLRKSLGSIPSSSKVHAISLELLKALSK